MNKVNQSKVEVEHRKSPKGSFEIIRRHISVALGGNRDIGGWSRSAGTRRDERQLQRLFVL